MAASSGLNRPKIAKRVVGAAPIAESAAKSPPIIWKPRPTKEWGVVTGCDRYQEWMLRWWLNHYEKHNQHPICFADFGMSREAVLWCQSHGHSFINLRFGSRKRTWFKKPLAILGSPFERVFWIDLDCEIRGDIAPLFSYAERGVAVTLDPHNPWVKTKPVVASGIVGAKHGNPLIIEWAQLCMRGTRVRGDQEILNQLIHTKRDQMAIMPPEYQWLRLDGNNPNALIMHWTGTKGNDHIRAQMGLPPLLGHHRRFSVAVNRRPIKQVSGTGRSKRKRNATSILASRSAKRRLRVRKIQRDISPRKKRR